MVENTATQPVSCKTFEQFISLLRANNQHAKTDGAFNSSGTGQNSAAAFVQLVLSNPSDAMVCLYKAEYASCELYCSGTPREPARIYLRHNLLHNSHYSFRTSSNPSDAKVVRIHRIV